MPLQRRPNWHELIFRTDPMVVDIGMGGEVLMAKIRLAIIALLALIPIKSLLFAPHLAKNWIGVLTVALGFMLAVFLAYVVKEQKVRRWVPWVSTQFDVLCISLGAAALLFSGRPIIASNNFVHFCVYLLAIFATALRADPVIVIASGVAALLQYGAIIILASQMALGVVDPEYGRFNWDTQLSRLILIVLETLLALAVVVRNHDYWLSSVRDKLTGLRNRRFFDEFLEHKVAECKRHKRIFALIFMDVDRFKNMNDEYGHAKGDEILQKIGHALDEFFRDGDLIARYGGEEFTLILPEAGVQGLTPRLNDFRARLKKLDATINPTATFGVAFYPIDALDAVNLIRVADERMYAGKTAGRDRIHAND